VECSTVLTGVDGGMYNCRYIDVCFECVPCITATHLWPIDAVLPVLVDIIYVMQLLKMTDDI